MATLDNTLNNYKSLTGGQPAIANGLCTPVISGVGATRTLTADESGSVCLFDAADGVVYTLPAIDSTTIGMEFHFRTTVTITSNAAKVITNDTSAEFIVGAIMSANATVAASGDIFTANGTTHVAISENGTTTGGVIGDQFTLTAINATQWLITGYNSGSGTNATPFATS